MGGRDRTAGYLEERTGTTPWARAHLRWIHEQNVHELRATNRGLSEARSPLIMSWHDDMFLRADWLVPELLMPFDRYPDQPTRLEPGKRIGFDLAVADKDVPATSPLALNEPEEDRVAWIYWGPQWAGLKAINAGNLGELILGTEP